MCSSVEIENITLEPSVLQVGKNQIASAEFPEPKNTLEADGSYNTCGAKAYTITYGTNEEVVTDWAYIYDSYDNPGGKTLWIDTALFPDPVTEDTSVTLTIIASHETLPS